MRILSVSDVAVPELLEGPSKNLSEGIDLIVSCGDLPPEYLTSLAHVYRAPLYYVSGNHDLRYESKPPEGCINLHGRFLRIDGFKILGLEGSFWYNGGPFQYTEKQMRKFIRRLRPTLWRQKGIDVRCKTKNRFYIYIFRFYREFTYTASAGIIS